MKSAALVAFTLVSTMLAAPAFAQEVAAAADAAPATAAAPAAAPAPATDAAQATPAAATDSPAPAEAVAPEAAAQAEAAAEAAAVAAPEAAASLAPAASGLSEKVAAAVGAPADGKALVVFFRPSKFTGGAIGFKVREAEQELGKLKNGSYFALQVEPGKHSYVVHSEAKDVTDIEAEAGETYFLAASISMGFLAGRPNLSPSDAAAFEAVLPKIKKSLPLN